VQKSDHDIHKTLINYNERPLYLLMNPDPPEDAKELPITLFEETISVVGDKAKTEFTKTPYEIFSDEAERITAVHCAKVLTDDVGGSVVGPHYATLHKAIKMLNQRVKVLLQILSDMDTGKLKPDHRIMRDIKGLCNRLPTMDSREFKEDFLSEYNDDLLVVYLSSITKGTQLIGEVMDKFQVAQQSKRGGGMLPPMF
jgi:COP9 signalosome complex subunit 6